MKYSVQTERELKNDATALVTVSYSSDYLLDKLTDVIESDESLDTTDGRTFCVDVYNVIRGTFETNSLTVKVDSVVGNETNTTQEAYKSKKQKAQNEDEEETRRKKRKS